jgi:glycosyltransferase involved in cell wall biosynthesis
MKIGIIGTRGIPNEYGGFEQLAEYLSLQLVQRGHEVTVYNSSLHSYTSNNYQGVRIIHCFDAESKMGTAGQFIYDLNCIRHTRRENYDIILQLGYTSSSLWAFLLPRRAKIVTNMDGLEWQRSKYNALTKYFLKHAEKWAVHSSNALVADSLGIQNYLKERYNTNSSFIAYGAELVEYFDEKIVNTFGLQKENFYLVIARIEPENNIETIIKGFLNANTNAPLVIIGSMQTRFGNVLRLNYTSKKIIFLGAIYDKRILDTLRHYCSIYFHGHSVGGTNPSLLEAMAAKAFIAAHDNIFNRSVLNEDALYFENEMEVSRLIEEQSERLNSENALRANEHKINTLYSWEGITTAYEQLMEHLLK